MMSAVLDAVGSVLGALLAPTAAIGLLRLPDLLSRMHAATKPQTVGLLLMVIGTPLILRTSADVWMLTLAGAFQLIAAPVTAHVVARLACRSGGVRPDLLHVDELAARRRRPRRTCLDQGTCLSFVAGSFGSYVKITSASPASPRRRRDYLEDRLECLARRLNRTRMPVICDDRM